MESHISRFVVLRCSLIPKDFTQDFDTLKPRQMAAICKKTFSKDVGMHEWKCINFD